MLPREETRRRRFACILCTMMTTTESCTASCTFRESLLIFSLKSQFDPQTQCIHRYTRITYLMSTTSAIYSRHDVGLVRQAGRRLHTQEHVQCQSLKPNPNDRVNGSFSELTTPDHDSWKYVQHAVVSPLTATAPAHGKSMSIKQCSYLQAEMQPRRSEKATRAWLKQIKKLLLSKLKRSLRLSRVEKVSHFEVKRIISILRAHLVIFRLGQWRALALVCKLRALPTQTIKIYPHEMVWELEEKRSTTHCSPNEMTQRPR